MPILEHSQLAMKMNTGPGGGDLGIELVIDSACFKTRNVRLRVVSGLCHGLNAIALRGAK